VNVIMNLQVPQIAGKFLSGCTTGGMLSSAQRSIELVKELW
jgi:hypothetical protein